jgi:hypothetical protein
MSQSGKGSYPPAPCFPRAKVNLSGVVENGPPDPFCLVQDLLRAGLDAQKGEAGAAGSDRQNFFGLVDGGFKLGYGGVSSVEETSSNLLHQGSD